MQPHCIWDAKTILGEGPVWDPGTQRLLWTDIKDRRLLIHDSLQGTSTTVPLEQSLCCFAARERGGFIAAYAKTLAMMDDAGKITQVLENPEKDCPDNRFNDGKAGPDGAFWFGSMDNGETAPTGSLYRLAPNLTLTRIATSVVITNGPAFSPDGQILYFTHTKDRKIYAYRLSADGEASDPDLFLTFTADEGHPDGMTVDSEGCLWITLFGGSSVRRYSADGRWIDELRLPVSNITSCAFGGDDLGTLFITTARWLLSPDQLKEQPLAGGLFQCRPGVHGIAPYRFAN